MTTAAPFTPEIALAMATDYIQRSEQWLPPIGIPFGELITGKSSVVVFDIREFDNADAFGLAFIEMVAQVKANLRAGLVESGWAESHKEVGISFSVYPCDDHGEHAIDLSTNMFTKATGVVMKARLFAQEIQ